jgi:hypothetical protein
MHLKRINLYKKYNPEESFEKITEKLGIKSLDCTQFGSSGKLPSG